MGILTFQAAAGGALNLNGPNIAGTVNLTLPSADGTSGQPLQTNGSGTLSFANLAIANGGTGATSFTANQIHYGSFSQSAGLTFDGTNFATTGTATAAKLIPTGTSVTGNGMYLPATNALGFSTNGTNAVYIDASQNVGIGTTSPSTGTLNKQLTINSGASALAGVVLQNNTSGTSSSDGFAVYLNSTNAALINYEAGALSFGTSGAETGRFDSSGNLLVGDTTVGGSPPTGPWISSKRGYVCKAGNTGSYGTNVFNLYYTGSATQLWIDSSNLGTITTVSDYRLKDKVETQLIPAINRINQLRPVTFEFKDYGSIFKADGIAREGFIAHELQAVIPSAVEGEKDLENQMQSLRLDALCSVMVKAIQEQQALITQLTDRIAALEAK